MPFPDYCLLVPFQRETPDGTMFHIFQDQDIDYQKNVSCISGHWKHFTDPHSGISHYKVGLGTQPNSYDVEPSIDVGLRTGKQT